MNILIRQYESNNLTQEQFLSLHKIPKSTFSYWLKKYRNEKSNSRNKENFIPVKVSTTDNTDNIQGVLEVVYPNGVRLVCSEGIDLSRLKPLIIL